MANSVAREASLWSRAFPPPPHDLADALIQFQYTSVVRQIPALHIVALLNVLMIATVLSHQDAAPATYMWMPLIAVFNVFRIWQWHRRPRTGALQAEARRFVRMAGIAAASSVTLISGYSAWSVAARIFDYPVLIPVSVAFGAFSIAHCFAALRTAASTVLVIGVFPSAAVMIGSGDFLSICIAVSASSVVLLQLRFIDDHQNHIISSLRVQAEVQVMALRDGLTGLYNRRAFLDMFAPIVATTRRAGQQAALLVIDIDHFKRINDGFGHDVGDRVLTRFAHCLVAECRTNDIVARFGGEEFIVLAATTTPDTAIEVAARLTIAIAATDFSSSDCPVARITASIGVHCIEASENFATAFGHADAALYVAKRTGRNRAMASDPARATRQMETNAV